MGFNPFKIIKKLGKGVESMFRGGKNPAENARPYMEPIPGYGREAYNPFIEQGREAYGKLSPEYIKMFLEPESIYNREVAGYEPSAQYQFMQPQLMQALRNSAASGGYAGTDADQLAQGDLVRALLSQDLGNYINNIRDIRGVGMTGLETATGRGFQSAGSLADYLGNAAGNRANLEFAGKAQQGINKNAFVSSLLGAAAQGLGAYFGAAGGGGMGGGMAGGGAAGGQRTGQSLGQIQTRLPYSPERAYGATGYNPRGGR